MRYTGAYRSPLGELLLACDGESLTGLWFEGAKYFGRGLDGEWKRGEGPVLAQTGRWLDLYFSGREPGFTPPVRLTGTPFQRLIWELLREIPYGTTTTYGALAKTAAERLGVPHMSARAVGAAVGRNPISLILPCHRVVGAKGSLTGYAAGCWRKRELLALEGLEGKGAPEG